jgi:hypothetical protein
MSWSYNTNPPDQIAFVRLLIPDTDPIKVIFTDEEINMLYQIQGSTFQSGMFFSGAAGRNIPPAPLSYVRVAALALDTLANNKGRLGAVMQLLDVKLDASKAAAVLREGAKTYREIDDEAGCIMIIEQTNTDWSFRDRWWKQWQRQSAGLGNFGG